MISEIGRFRNDPSNYKRSALCQPEGDLAQVQDVVNEVEEVGTVGADSGDGGE